MFCYNHSSVKCNMPVPEGSKDLFVHMGSTSQGDHWHLMKLLMWKSKSGQSSFTWFTHLWAMKSIQKRKVQNLHFSVRPCKTSFSQRVYYRFHSFTFSPLKAGFKGNTLSTLVVSWLSLEWTKSGWMDVSLVYSMFTLCPHSMSCHGASTRSHVLSAPTATPP